MKKPAGLVRELEDQFWNFLLVSDFEFSKRLSGSDQQQRFRCGGGQGGRLKVEGIPAGVF